MQLERYEQLLTGSVLLTPVEKASRFEQMLGTFRQNPIADLYNQILYDTYGNPNEPNQDQKPKRKPRTVEDALVKIGFSPSTRKLDSVTYADPEHPDKSDDDEPTEFAEFQEAIIKYLQEPNNNGVVAEILFEWADMFHLAYYSQHLSDEAVSVPQLHDALVRIALVTSPQMPEEIENVRESVVGEAGVATWLSCLQYLAGIKLQTMVDPDNPRNSEKRTSSDLKKRISAGDQEAPGELVEWKKKRDRWEKSRMLELTNQALDGGIDDKSIKATLTLVKQSLSS